MSELPRVTIVFLVYNRRDELELSLRKMTQESDYPPDRLDVIVVDNASEDGSQDMVRERFPQVQVIRREENVGVSGWNDGFAAAQGDYVLALDDDCYLPPDGLRRAVEAAGEHAADLVSFGVRAASPPDYRFDRAYKTGLLAFWGCAVLMRREVLERLGGYDPEIFVWANEVELMLRFYDAGFKHLHVPEIVAVHLKEITGQWPDGVGNRAYLVNARHFSYVAAKHLRTRHAVGTLTAVVATCLRHGVLLKREAFKGIPEALKGFARGLRHRDPVRPEISRVYRHSFESFASPWWMSRPLPQLVLSLPETLVRRVFGRELQGPHPGRRAEYYERNARYYPEHTAALKL